MKPTRFTLLLLGLLAAILAGTVLRLGPQKAGAVPLTAIAINPDICFLLLVDPDAPSSEATAILGACGSLSAPDEVELIADCVEGETGCSTKGHGDGDGEIELEDFEAIELDGNQMHDKDGALIIVAFVNDDDPVLFETDVGIFVDSGDDDYLCDTSLEDADCDGDPGTRGDGVVAAGLIPAGAELGPGLVEVHQETIAVTVDFTVVGEPDDVEFTTLEDIIQTGLTQDTCPLETTAEGFLDAVAEPEKTLVLANVLDREGNSIAGALVEWETNDEEIGIVATDLTPTIDLGAFGFGAPNVLCGTQQAGTVTVTASITRQVFGLGLDPQAQEDDNSIEFTVVGEPASITLAADPPSLLCDGVNASTITATVTDSEGNAVADGQEVRFEVRVLGTAEPITGKTTGGEASSAVTPATGVTAGVPVVVTAGDAQASILIACEEAAPPPPPPAPPPPPSGVIAPPPTGSGGYLPSTPDAAYASGLALAIAFAALCGARLLLGRRTS